jgi:hypothetical protein
VVCGTFGADNAGLLDGIHAANQGAALGREVVEDGADVRILGRNLDGHDGLQQTRRRLRQGLLHALRGARRHRRLAAPRR